MMDMKTYGYTEIDAIPDELLLGRVTELRRERFTIMTEQGEVTAVLKGAFYHSEEKRVDSPCVGDFVLLRLTTVRCRVNGGSIMLPSSMRTSMSRIKQATSSTKGLETKRLPCGANKRRKTEAGRYEY